MRIVFLGSSSSFISSIIYNALKKALKDSDGFELAYAIDTAPDDMETRLMRQDLITTIVRYLVIKIFGKQKISWRWFGEMKGQKIANINSPKFVRKLKLDDIDIILSVGCVQKLGSGLLNSFQCVNYHNSLLPKYRGLYSMSWQIYFKDEIGYTWHRIAENWDSGNILIQHTLYDSLTMKGFNGVLSTEVKKTLQASKDLHFLLTQIESEIPGRLQQGKPSYYGQRELDALPKNEWAKICFGWNIAPEEFIPKWMLGFIGRSVFYEKSNNS